MSAHPFGAPIAAPATTTGTTPGGDGDDFAFNLTGTAVPEPATALLLVAAGAMVRRRA